MTRMGICARFHEEKGCQSMADERTLERIIKLEAKLEELEDAINKLERRLDTQDQDMANMRDSIGKLTPISTIILTILTTCIGTMVGTFLHVVIK